ncbi:hypothetical protein RRG08_047490 [Elysia crispata]|uniref:Uncharacterized protein n=1 Tax=Elysia crispata TaxID=231223 RepID=A0AAE0ZS04_9GAST|nr:hypothetical protein RRG08_047490 [Elysia crispata]
MAEFRVRTLDESSGGRGSQDEKPNYVNPSLRLWSETLDALEDCVQDVRRHLSTFRLIEKNRNKPAI